MSNEKPVRITVGDVKEVVEATTIQSDTVVSKPVSSVSYTASVPDTSGKGMMYVAGLVGFILVVIAGYFGVANVAKPGELAGSNVPNISAPAAMPGSTGSAPTNNNAPAAAASGTTDANAPASSAPPAANNSPAK